MKNLCIALAAMSLVACGQPEEEEEPPPIEEQEPPPPPPVELQEPLAEPTTGALKVDYNSGFTLNVTPTGEIQLENVTNEDEDVRYVKYSAPFKLERKGTSSYRYYAQYSLQVQKRDTNDTGLGHIAVIVGSNSGGRTFDSEDDIIEYEKDGNFISAFEHQFAIAMKKADLADDTSDIPPTQFRHSKFTVRRANPGSARPRVPVYSWYKRISGTRTLTIRFLSDYGMDELWEEQRNAIVDFVNSIEVIEER